MNNIPQLQNSQRNLELLAAQRQIYSEAKRSQMVSIALGVPVVISWSIAVAIQPKLAVYAGLWGVFAVFLELVVLAGFQKRCQSRAAKIQQVFDCNVLQFDWERLNCGLLVEPEVIFDAGKRYKKEKNDFNRLTPFMPGKNNLSTFKCMVGCTASPSLYTMDYLKLTINSHFSLPHRADWRPKLGKISASCLIAFNASFYFWYAPIIRT